VIKVVLALALVFPMAAEPISSADREKLLNHLARTRKLFLDSIAGVSEAQWKFKPAPDRWSIAECAEHITVTEEALFGLITTKFLHTPPDTEKRPEGRVSDEEVIRVAVDRSVKGKAPEVIQPAGRFAGKAAVIEEFNMRRDRTVEFVRTTQEDLRARVTPGRTRLDGVQHLLRLSAHSERHTLQIEEVKADPGYPPN